MKMLDRKTLPEFEARLRTVAPEAAPRFGSLPVAAMMPHLRTLMEVSLEELSVPDFPAPFSKTFLFRWGALYLPWPKGKLKAPETLFPPAAEPFHAEREKLAAAMRRFVEALEADPSRRTRSPLLGPIPLKVWAQIHAKHLNHHLEQFGA